VEEYQSALDVLNDVLKLKLEPEQRPRVLLAKAEAYQGMDSTDTAIATYKDVTVLFGKGIYGAEAQYRLGWIWESRDSLELAKKHYERVAGAYAESEFASEAIRRGGNISRLLKLKAVADEDSPEAQALRQFTLAELQLLQFEDPEEAVNIYGQIIEAFPASEYAPKAAYAVGYIYKTIFGDTARAREAYTLLRTRYPDTPQAVHAGYLIGAGGVDVPYVPPSPLLGDTLRVPPGTTGIDSTRAPGIIAKPGTSPSPGKVTKPGASPVPANVRKPGSPPLPAGAVKPDTTRAPAKAAKPDTTQRKGKG